MPKKAYITFSPSEFKGSRFRCLLLTHRSKRDVSHFFNSLVTPASVTTKDDLFAPIGFLQPGEAKLGESSGFLTDEQRAELTNWWLAKPGRANTPNWDLISQCTVENKRGLILVEAKAHEKEFDDDRCGATNKENFKRIKQALAEATEGWNTSLPGFNLTANSYYQLSNRFAFAWKLATMNIPVVLVYLGFLDADEMSGRIILRNHAQWHDCVVNRAKGVVPTEVWNRTLYINGTPLTVLIRSAKVCVNAEVATIGGSK